MTPRAVFKTEEGGFSFLGKGAGAFLDFTTGSLPAGITFTRASIGTYNDSGGILRTATNNVARFNYVLGVSNLLIEGSATNLFVQSNAFSNASWIQGGGAAIAAAQFISPDGSNNGWSLTNTIAAGASIQETIVFSNIPYTVSIWAKRITGTSPILFILDGAGPASNPTTTTITRFSATLTPAAGSANTPIFNDTVSGNVTGIYGAQLETGSIATSYIPTTTTSVTRAADSATFTIPAGVVQLKYTFDDNSTQLVSVSPGSYTIPTNLNRPNIKTIDTILGASLNFDFTTGVLPGAITFTRSSIGTYFNNSGVLITSGNDIARFNYVSGVANLLIEGSATNMLLQSNNFSDVTWTPGASPVISPAQFISPDGTNDGWSFTSGTGFAYIFQVATGAGSGTHTISMWAKLIAGNVTLVFQLGAGQSIVGPPTATIARFSGTMVNPGGGDAVKIMINGPSGNTHGFFGAQVETGSIPTSYIPTTTAAVTRSADNAVFTIPAGIGNLTYTFDDNSTQLVTVSSGSYTIPTNLNRPNIKSIVGSA